jgi:hypothetical protein
MTTDSNSTATTTPIPRAANTTLMILFDYINSDTLTPKDLQTLQSVIGPAVEQWLILSARSKKLPAPQLPISIQILGHNPK